MKFKQYVKERGGVTAFARTLGFKPETVFCWLRRGAIPKPLVMEQIVKTSNGRVTYQSIINDTRKT